MLPVEFMRIYLFDCSREYGIRFLKKLKLVSEN